MTTRKPLVLVNGLFQELATPGDKLDFAGNTTTDLTEGTNLYYTDARARGSISLSTVNPAPATGLGSLTYNSSTGAFTFTQVTDSVVRGLFSAATATGITYNSTTGQYSLASIPNSSLINSVINIIDAFGVTTAVPLGNSPAYDVGPAATIIELVRNETGAAIPRGTPVAIVGYASSRPLVAPANASDPTKMPAIGLAYEQIPNNSNGSVVAIGIAKQVDTSTYSICQTLYVGTTAGTLTNTPPTGEGNLIQNIGKISDVATNGRVLVLGPGRTNAVPNLNSGNIFLGNVSNQAVATSLTTSVVPEGTNQYFTQSRARTSISVTDTGGDGSLSYDNSTGVITYTGPSASDVRAHFSVAAGSGLTYNSSTGVFGTSAIPNSQLANSSVTVGSTSIALGSTATTIAGLLSLTSDAVHITAAGSANGLTLNNTGIIFEGATADTFETTLSAVDPTADQTINLPNASGTIALLTSLSATNSGTGFGSLSYNNTTGAFTYTVVTAANIRQQISVNDTGGDGSLSYDNTTGVITYAGPTAADARGYFSVAAGSGLTYNSSTGVFGTSAIPNSQLANSSVTIGTTAIALGATSTTLAGLTSFTSTGITTRDSGFRIQNNSDTTKQIAFSAASISTATTRTMTVPDENGTIATQDFATAIAIALG